MRDLHLVYLEGFFNVCSYDHLALCYFTAVIEAKTWLH